MAKEAPMRERMDEARSEEKYDGPLSAFVITAVAALVLLTAAFTLEIVHQYVEWPLGAGDWEIAEAIAIGSSICALGIFSLGTWRRLVRETTERERAEEALRVANHELRERTADLRSANAQLQGELAQRNRAEEELRASEERLKILFESAPDAYYLNDLNGNFVDGNKAAEEVTGYEREELVGKNFLELDLLPEDQIPKAAALLARNARGESTGPDELALNRKDGKQVPLEIRTFPVSINGEPQVLGIARDITERKRAEKALRNAHSELETRVKERTADLVSANEQLQEEIAERMRAEEALRAAQDRLQHLLSCSAAVVYSTKPSMGHATTYISENVALLLGYDAQEFLDDPQLWVQRIHPEDMRRISAELSQLSEREHLTLEYRFRWMDGTYRWIRDELKLLRDQGGNPLEVIGTILDITEDKRAEEALRESEERFRRMFEAAFEGIAIHENGVILDANPAFEKTFGYPLSELVGKSVLDLAAEESRALIIDKLRSPPGKPYEAVGLKKDGTLLNVEIAGREHVHKGRRVRVTAVRDISQRKRMEEALQAARDELEGKVERQLLRPNPYGLTFRELTVLHLVAAGESDKQIGLKLGISHFTAQKHTSNILAKMGAGSRTEAAARALREGLLD